jgi:hypothetical protein
MSTSSYWNLAGTTGRLTCGPLTGRVLLNGLGGGLLDVAWNGIPRNAFNVLQLRPPLVDADPQRELLDSFVRGNDLVATYQGQPPLTVSPQIYWRAKHESARSAVAVEVVLSMRTDLLDSQPFSAVDSIVANCVLFHAEELDSRAFRSMTSASVPGRFISGGPASHLFVFRNEQSNLSYAEMVHPSDFAGAEIDYRGEATGSVRLRSVLFPERLEKGVIRRARVCGWFLPAENDLAVAVELARQFINEPLPLTT